MRVTWWKDPGWNALCDVCGQKYKNTDLRERWDGLMVCTQDWEPQHPQLLIRPIPDQQPIPWSRPEPVDTFITHTYNPVTDQCSVMGHYCQADYMEADCAIVGAFNGNLVI